MQIMHLKNKIATKGSEGEPQISWSEGVQIAGETWPTGGDLQVKTYGDKVNNMLNVRICGSYKVNIEGNHFVYDFVGFSLQEGDGLCIIAGVNDTPDYRIVRIIPYKPLTMEVEKI